MKFLNLIQGTDGWSKERLKNLCASEAPVIMGVSKFMTREELLALKKGWIQNPVSAFIKHLFQKGHEHEAEAREIQEMDDFEDMPAVVGSREIEGILFLASFDGLSSSMIPWEHKDWNEILAENVRNGVLTPEYCYQLEQQMFVAGVEWCRFTCSDGTYEKRVSMIYKSDPEKRKKLIAHSKLFLDDLKDYVLEAKQELIVAKDIEKLPSLDLKINGSIIASNAESFLKEITDRSHVEMNRVLETDQDFADKDQLNKDIKKLRDESKEKRKNVVSEFVSFSDFSDYIEKIDNVLKKMYSDGTAKVKNEKIKKVEAVKIKAIVRIRDYVDESQKSISFSRLHGLMNIFDDNSLGLDEAVKGLKTIKSIENAVAKKTNEWIILADSMTAKIGPNLAYLRKNATDFGFLFKDSDKIILFDHESLRAIVDSRIKEQKDKQQKIIEEKLEQEREKIRLEEKEKHAKADRELAEKAEKERQAALEKVDKDVAKVDSNSAFETEKFFDTEKEFKKIGEGRDPDAGYENRGVGFCADNETPEPSIDSESLKDASLVDALKQWKEAHKISTRAISDLCRILSDHKIRIND